MSTIMNPLILLTVGVFICVVSITVQVTADCGDIFQSHSCTCAGFYDCCQVIIE